MSVLKITGFGASHLRGADKSSALHQQYTDYVEYIPFAVLRVSGSEVHRSERQQNEHDPSWSTSYFEVPLQSGRLPTVEIVLLDHDARSMDDMLGSATCSLAGAGGRLEAALAGPGSGAGAAAWLAWERAAPARLGRGTSVIRILSVRICMENAYKVTHSSDE
jgi:hypothetical protein